MEKGADGLVLVASGAGDHGGIYNPITFVHEVREFFDGPIALFGGMSKGEDILLTEILGADFAYIGTRFISTLGSGAKDAYKNMIVDSSIKDIIYTDAFSGINANYLVPSIVNAGLDPDKLKKKKEKIDFSKMSDPEMKARKDVWWGRTGSWRKNQFR
nr:nitronate monooxygenase [Oceanobacillus senegalensis]